jgi:serine/threonine protein kinase
MEPKNLIDVSVTEWAAAEKFFSDPQNKDSNKMPRARRLQEGYGILRHSFLKVDGIIYAMDNRDSNNPEGKYLGEGGSGKISVVQTKNGDNFALKVALPIKTSRRDNELAIMKMLGKLVGAIIRKGMKNFTFEHKKSKIVKEKHYTIQKLHLGMDLWQQLHRNGTALSTTQLLLLSSKMLQEIHNMHRLNILHNDVKPRNFITDVNGLNVNVNVIDFGSAQLLPAGQDRIYNAVNVGTPAYEAPETLFINECSFASDIYALGIIFKNFSFGLNVFNLENLKLLWMLHSMTHSHPSRRPGMTALRLQFYQVLSQQTDYHPSDAEKAEIAKLRLEAAQEDEAKTNHALQSFRKKGFVMKGLIYLFGLGDDLMLLRLKRLAKDIAGILADIAGYSQDINLPLVADTPKDILAKTSPSYTANYEKKKSIQNKANVATDPNTTMEVRTRRSCQKA